MPATLTNENVDFNGVLTSSVVLREVGTVKTLIPWACLTAGQQTQLDDLVDDYGGMPIAATAGTQTVDVGGAKVLADPTGFAAAAPSYHEALYSVPVIGANPTGLANTTRAYALSVVVDNVEYPITVLGNAAQTFTTLVAAVDAALPPAVTVAIVGSAIRVTSSGTPGQVLIRDAELFQLTNDYVNLGPAGNTGVVGVYTATVTVDGTPISVSVDGAIATDYTNLLAGINTDLGVAATATLTGGNVLITSATTGSASTVVVSADRLFQFLTGYVGINTSDRGVDDLADAIAKAGYDYSACTIERDYKPTSPTTSPCETRLETEGLTLVYYGGELAFPTTLDWRFWDTEVAV